MRGARTAAEVADLVACAFAPIRREPPSRRRGGGPRGKGGWPGFTVRRGRGVAGAATGKFRLAGVLGPGTAGPARMRGANDGPVLRLGPASAVDDCRAARGRSGGRLVGSAPGTATRASDRGVPHAAAGRSPSRARRFTLGAVPEPARHVKPRSRRAGHDAPSGHSEAHGNRRPMEITGACPSLGPSRAPAAAEQWTHAGSRDGLHRGSPRHAHGRGVPVAAGGHVVRVLVLPH
jgi:hypothetical protein